MYRTVFWVCLLLPLRAESLSKGAQDGDVRLADGRSPYEGRVEIFHSGIWGTVCDDKWTRREAAVVCHMIGAMRENASVRAYAEFGNGVGSIWLDEVSCRGDESSLVNCSHTDWGVNDCTHAEDVGVVCVPKEETTKGPSSTVPPPPKFYVAPQEKIVLWGQSLQLTCFTPYEDLSKLNGHIVWCKNDIVFLHQSLDSQNSTGQWVYEVDHALSIHTGTYTCGLDRCQRNLATVDVTDVPVNECKLLHLQNPNCEREKLNDIGSQIDYLTEGNVIGVDVDHVISTALPKLADVVQEGISSADSLDRTVDILQKMTSVADDANVSIHTTTFITVMDHILSTNRTTAWQNQSTSVDSSVDKILKTVSTFGHVLAKTVRLNQNVTFSRENLVMTVAREPLDTVVQFPAEVDSDSTHLVLPPQLQSNQSDFSYVATMFKSLSGILSRSSASESPRDSEAVVSNVLALSLNGEKRHVNLSPPLHMSFNHPTHDSSVSEILCGYWNASQINGSRWSTDGCVVTQTGENFTNCRCNHLTNFAILVRPYQTETPDVVALKWISIIGCCVSVFFCVVTVLIFLVLWRFIKSDMNLLILNLCVNIALAYILFIVGVERTENEITCLVITVFLQYLFLVVFCLMLDIGIYYFVHVTLVKISFIMANRFTSKSRKSLFLVIAYGAPAVLTGLTLGVTYPDKYRLHNMCWLSLPGGALYGFLVPVALIVLVNLVIVITLVITMYSTQLASTGTVRRKAIMGIRSISTLLPVLGITWLFGFLSVSEDVIVFQYIFAILNSLQGFFIFLSNCVFNKKLKDTITKKSRKQSMITQSSQDKMSFVANSEVGEEGLSEITSKLSMKKSGRIKALNKSLYN
ncbi:adhesion G protein-coupled receptor L2-like [Crassostrea virginica]